MHLVLGALVYNKVTISEQLKPFSTFWPKLVLIRLIDFVDDWLVHASDQLMLNFANSSVRPFNLDAPKILWRHSWIIEANYGVKKVGRC